MFDQSKIKVKIKPINQSLLLVLKYVAMIASWVAMGRHQPLFSGSLQAW